jgi:hypothetical protein
MKKQSFMNNPRFAKLSPGEKQAIADYYRAKYYEHLNQLELEKIQSLPQEDRLRYYWESTHHDPQNATEHEFELFKKVYGTLDDPRPDIQTIDAIFDNVLLKKSANTQQPTPVKKAARDFPIPENLYSFLAKNGRTGLSTLKVIMWFYKVQQDNGVTTTKKTICQETKLAFETASKALDTLKKLKVIKQVAPCYYVINNASKWRLI